MEVLMKKDRCTCRLCRDTRLKKQVDKEINNIKRTLGGLSDIAGKCKRGDWVRLVNRIGG